jgi:SpoVK/Ycf46/Vps4 family AAA+-type ATPase
VVFMDEVDGLLSSRSDLHRYASKREVLNELMAGWDGLLSDSSGVVVMAATNRPFDLDEAVLRRLPRRLMIDLPDEAGRSAILKMVLRDEQLADDVKLQVIAQQTPGYSGSDLKNICLHAAMNAVRDLVATSSKEHRVMLSQKHFIDAKKAIAPSIAEEADGLIQLRRWNAQYGEGAIRKVTHWGF